MGKVGENERCLEDSRDIGIGNGGLGFFLGFFMMQVIFRNEQAGRVELGCQEPDLVTHIENRLLAWRYRSGKLTVVTLIPEPQRALQTC